MKEHHAIYRPLQENDWQTANGVSQISVVVIGRNEGQRLIRCLESVHACGKHVGEIIYVDSASHDDSCANASRYGARVLSLETKTPNAAKARNLGWQQARGQFVLFLDGDTILQAGFIEHALHTMQDSRVAVVWGHRRETAPQQSLYVRVMDLDWIYQAGNSQFCGGDAFMRRSVLVEVGGFDEKFLAGEEPEMCQRIRANGGLITHIDVLMTLHDLAIDSYKSYWQRAYRAGHAYAQVAQRYRSTPEKFWQHESRHNLLHASLLMLAPCFALLMCLLLPHYTLCIFLFSVLSITVLLARSMRRSAYKSANAETLFLYALHSQFQQIPIFFGQLAYFANHFLTRSHTFTDYKELK